MSSTTTENSNDSDNLCVVCFKNVEIYSIGSCDHAVCFECSTRMRILCGQDVCPICRRKLPTVLFTKSLEPFSTIFPRFEHSNLQDPKHGIVFSTVDVERAYSKLLEHRCSICKESSQKNWAFRTFRKLEEHMRREHELYYCNICSDHLKIFSFERKCYNRPDLAYHRRKGDKNNTSHRGHPLCEFCDLRFMDNDELFRHLRRNHLFCHFCDADGKHQYYNCMDDLKRHFRDEHYLCQEGECESMPLTAVFRTDIDLKAHIATDHSKFMSKSATRQARTLELEFTMAPRSRTDNIRSRKPNNERRDRFDDPYCNDEPGEGSSGSYNPPQQQFVNPLTLDQFPALGGASASNNITLVSKNYTKFSSAVFNSQDFPSLGGVPNRPASSAVTITANSAGPSAPEVTITRTVRNQSAPKRESFPVLGGPAKSAGSGGSTVRLSVNSSNSQPQAPKVSIKVNQKSNGAITTHITTSAPSTSQQQRSAEVFPALAGDVPVVPKQPQWVQPKSKKQPEEVKQPSKPSSTRLETSDLNSFPSLSRNKNDKPKKTSSVTVPVDNWVNLNTMKNGSKVSKKSETTDNKPASSKLGTETTKVPGGEPTSSSKKATNKSNNKKTTSKPKNQPNSHLEEELARLKLVSSPSEEIKKSKKKKNKNNEVPNNNESRNLDQNENLKNGMKKRSELKIGTLNSPISEDVPVVEAPKPPPGFQPSSASVKPPPGFSSDQFPPLNHSTNDLTFTNSTGQSYAISPSRSYNLPNNFQNRNQHLIQRFMEVLNDNDSIIEFKTLSDNFRKGEVPAAKYVDKCRNILGDKFRDIFPELLVLLPDVQKQQDLLKQLRGKETESLVVCENCRQIIFKQELSEHHNYHRLDSHFPTLGSAQQINSAWKK